MLSRRAIVASGVFAPALVSFSIARAQASPHTIEELSAPPVDRDAALSPNGKFIALASTRRIDENKDDSSITIIPADNPEKTLTVLPLGDRDIANVTWASDRRLLITLVIPLRRGGSSIGTRLASTSDPDERPKARRVLAIDMDGKNSVMLFGNDQMLREVPDLGDIVDPLPDDPDHILVKAANFSAGIYCLYKVNILTGEPELFERGTLKTRRWLTQAGVPVVRYDYNDRGTVQTIYVRAPGEAAWRFFRKLRGDQQSKAEFEFIGAAPQPGVMLALAPQGDDGALALREFDLRTLALGKTLASKPNRDAEWVLRSRKGELMGVAFIEDRLTYQFTDPRMESVYRGLNRYLGDVCNIRIFDISDDGMRFLARVTGPREPGTIYFYDRATKRFDGIGQAYPTLTPERLAPMETLSVRTRDGATITAYLTIPLAPGPRPLVVFPHGGPELRDHYDYQTFVQVLAAQGWLVLQPNFRGSGGYGKAFADAGRKRWGDRMQEDLEDAVAHVLASGRADPKRVAIAGASYGGYAALQGAVRHPDLYKAVVSIAGDCDLVESIAFSRMQDGPDSPSYLYWLETIGDPAKDRDMLKAASPALHAEKVQAPVLLIHGLEDVIVAPKQSRIMQSALKSAGKSVELIELKDVGHRDLREEHWNLVYSRTVQHIAKALA